MSLTTPKGPTMSDAELIGLAALANVEAQLMAGDNASRMANEGVPRWSTGTGLMTASELLSNELWNRGLKL